MSDMSMDNVIVAKLGISIEPLATISSLENTRLSETSSAMALFSPSNSTLKLVENLFNYCASFANAGLVPLKAMQDWYDMIQKKIKQDPSFLKN